MKRIGIDVGGTNTDAVLIADDRVIHSVKSATTADVTSGILAALKALRANPAAAVPADDDRIDPVSYTHLTLPTN